MRPAQHASYGSCTPPPLTTLGGCAPLRPSVAYGPACGAAHPAVSLAATGAQRKAAHRARLREAGLTSRGERPRRLAPAKTPPPSAPAEDLARVLSTAVGQASLGGLPRADVARVLSLLLAEVGGEPAPAAAPPSQAPAGAPGEPSAPTQAPAAAGAVLRSAAALPAAGAAAGSLNPPAGSLNLLTAAAAEPAAEPSFVAGLWAAARRGPDLGIETGEARAELRVLVEAFANNASWSQALAQEPQEPVMKDWWVFGRRSAGRHKRGSLFAGW
jgi:hypothetical protein